jgi:hypothetical protein
MKMSARVVFKTKVFDTTEDESKFAPVPLGLKYQQAIAMLRGNGETAKRTNGKRPGK